MDANETHYYALVTKCDWMAKTSQPAPEESHVEWSEKSQGLTLSSKLFEFRTNNQTSTSDQPGRGGVFDAHGNLYALSNDRRSVLIRSANGGTISTFWPVGGEREGSGAIEGSRTGRPEPASTAATFHAAQAVAASADVQIDALTVTSRHYLVCACSELQGLLVIDLHGGGPPLFQPWPGLRPVTAMVALEDGGILLLIGNIIHRLNRSLRALMPLQAQPPAFSPAVPEPPIGGPSAPAPTAPIDPCFIDVTPALPAGARATALGVDGRSIFVLAALADAPGKVWLSILALAGGAQDILLSQSPVQLAAAVCLNDAIEQSDEGGAADDFPLASHALALTKSGEQLSLFVVTTIGDQALRFAVSHDDQNHTFEVALQHEFWPMRRYEGLGLAALPAGIILHGYSRARIFYATTGRWAPLIDLARPCFVEHAELHTPIWDGKLDGCVWHRLLLDMRLPTGTRVRVETRACDGSDSLAIKSVPWSQEPELVRSARGRELPWREADAEEQQCGYGTWETLLQAARGRWFQARLTLIGKGQRSPVLRALRVWYPRFSYSRKYLPPIYSEEPSSADFLERFLALFEAEFTRWEDRIAAAQLLFDARTAPDATLDWLATWLGMAFDPADSDSHRRRLLLRYAARSYARRGTVPGMLLASTLAWEEKIDETWLDDPASLAARASGVRLQEFFSRVTPLPSSAWRPQLGRAALIARLDGNSSLTLSDDAAEAAARRTLLTAALGFMPRAAAEELRLWRAWQMQGHYSAQLPEDEPLDQDVSKSYSTYLERTRVCAVLRQRWQDFLARRYRRVSSLNSEWGTQWTRFEYIPSPLRVPASSAALANWHQFEARVLRMEPHAHRFRVVLPIPSGPLDVDELIRRRSTVQRVLEREKPAHTVAEVRLAFDLFRVGEARLEIDTLLHEGLARRPELAALSRSILGRAEIGLARLSSNQTQTPFDRVGLDRHEPLER